MGWFTELRSIVGNERGFIHKKLLGAVSKVTGFIPTPVSQIISRVTGRLSQTTAQKEAARRAKFEIADTARRLPSGETQAQAELRQWRELQTSKIVAPPTFGGGGGPAPCADPRLVRNSAGQCVAPTSPLGASTMFGEAVMGQYGAALVPGSQIIDRATCPRGTQLGKDGLCYNKSAITNKQRMWPAGRKPLLTGGEMGAISTAARAGRRMELATKRLQKMGMMKKPASRRALPRGHVARLEH